jgi:hypothetical protein
MAPLLRSSWCCRYFLTGIVVDLPDIDRLLDWLLTYT